MSNWRLVADVGGTNVRFARASHDGTLAHVISYRSDSIASFAEALASYADTTGGLAGCCSAAIGAAGPVTDGRVVLTNRSDWTIDARDLSSQLSGMPVVIVNDLEAVAAALPHLGEGGVAPIGGHRRSTDARKPRIAINVGTGFGAALVFNAGGIWRTLPGEPGHMSLSAVTPEELELLGLGASIEDFLSGNGISRLHARIAGNAVAQDANGVFQSAGKDRHAAIAVDLFTDVLGRVAGDLAFARGAWSGVYFCGSVAVGWSAIADQARFRASFERKGLLTQRMADVPVWIVQRPDVALYGLAMLSV